MSNPRRPAVTELNPHLICALCRGYFIDATTIVECLHTFCKSCIVRYLESSKFCPTCDVQVHKTKPLLSIRPDKTLQNIVYKIVPALYQNEMCRRKFFYNHCRDRGPISEEDGGNHVNQAYILPEDSISIALKPIIDDDGNEQGEFELCTRFFNCPAIVNVSQLKKLLRAKFDLPMNHPIHLFTDIDESLKDSYSLIDVAYMTNWEKKEPLTIHYKIFFAKKIKFDPKINERIYNLKVKKEVADVNKEVADVNNFTQVTKLEYPVEKSLQQCEVAKKPPLITSFKTEVASSKYDAKNSSLDALEKVIKDSEIGIHCSSDLQISCTSTYKAIIPAPAKSSKLINLNPLGMPTVDTIANATSCINYGLSLLTNSNGILSNIYSGNIINPTKFTGTMLPFGLTLAPSLLCTSYSDQSNISNLTLFSQNDDLSSNLLLPLATLDSSSVLPVQSMTQQSMTTALQSDMSRIQPHSVLLPKEPKKPKLIRPKEEPKHKPDKEVQLMITEAGVMLVSGGDNLSNLETVMNPVVSEANELLNRIENDALLASSENYSEDSNKSDGSDTGERLAQIKQEISTILDTLSKEANENVNFTSYGFVHNESIIGRAAPICNVMSSTLESIINSDTKKLKEIGNFSVACDEVLNVNNNLITRKKEEKHSLKRQDKHIGTNDTCNTRLIPENLTFKKGLAQPQTESNIVRSVPSTKKLKIDKVKNIPASSINHNLHDKAFNSSEPITCDNDKDKKAIESVDPFPITTATSSSPQSESAMAITTVSSEISNKLSKIVSCNSLSKLNISTISSDANLTLSKNFDNKCSKVQSLARPVGSSSTSKEEAKKKVVKKYQPMGYKTLKKTPKCWNPTIPREKLPIKNFQNSPKTNKFFKARNGYIPEKPVCVTVNNSLLPSKGSVVCTVANNTANSSASYILGSSVLTPSSKCELLVSKMLSIDMPSLESSTTTASEIVPTHASSIQKLKVNEDASEPGTDNDLQNKPLIKSLPKEFNNATSVKSNSEFGESLNNVTKIRKGETSSSKENVKTLNESAEKYGKMTRVICADKKGDMPAAKQAVFASQQKILGKVGTVDKNIDRADARNMVSSIDLNINNLKFSNSPISPSPGHLSPQKLSEQNSSLPQIQKESPLSKQFVNTDLNSLTSKTISCLPFDNSSQVYLQTIASLSNVQCQNRDQLLPYSLLPFATCPPVTYSLSPSKSISSCSFSSAVSGTSSKPNFDNMPLMQNSWGLPQNISSKHDAVLSELTLATDKGCASAISGTEDQNVKLISSDKHRSIVIPSLVQLSTSSHKHCSQKGNSSILAASHPTAEIDEMKDTRKKIKLNCLPTSPISISKKVSQNSDTLNPPVNVRDSSTCTVNAPASLLSTCVSQLPEVISKSMLADNSRNEKHKPKENTVKHSVSNNSLSQNSNAPSKVSFAAATVTSPVSKCSQNSLKDLPNISTNSEVSIAKTKTAMQSITSSSLQIIDSSTYGKVTCDLTKVSSAEASVISQNSKIEANNRKGVSSESSVTTISGKQCSVHSEIFPRVSESQSVPPAQSPLDNLASCLLDTVTSNQLSSSIADNITTCVSQITKSDVGLPCERATSLTPSTCHSFYNMELPTNQIICQTKLAASLDSNTEGNVQTYFSPMLNLAADFSSVATTVSSGSLSEVSSQAMSQAQLKNSNLHHNSQETSKQPSISSQIDTLQLSSKVVEPVNQLTNSSLNILNNLVSLVNVAAVSNPTLFSSENTTIATTVKSQTNLEICISNKDKIVDLGRNEIFASKAGNFSSNCSTTPISATTSSQYKIDSNTHSSIPKIKSSLVQSTHSNILKSDTTPDDSDMQLNAANYSLSSKLPLPLVQSVTVPASQSAVLIGATSPSTTLTGSSSQSATLTGSSSQSTTLTGPSSQSTTLTGTSSQSTTLTGPSSQSATLTGLSSQSATLTLASSQENSLTSVEELDRLLFQSISAATCKSTSMPVPHEIPLQTETSDIGLPSTAGDSKRDKVLLKNNLRQHVGVNDVDNTLASLKTIPTSTFASHCSGYISGNVNNQCIYHSNSSIGCQSANKVSCTNSKQTHTVTSKDYGNLLLQENAHVGISSNHSTQVSNSLSQALVTNNSSLPLNSSPISKQSTSYPIMSSHPFMPSITPVYQNEACKISLQTNNQITESLKSSQHVAVSASEQSGKNITNTSAVNHNKNEIVSSNSSVQSSQYNHNSGTSSTTTSHATHKKVHHSSSGYTDTNQVQSSNAKVNYNQNNQEFSSIPFNAMMNNFHEGMAGVVPTNLSSSSPHKNSQFSWENNPFSFNSNSFSGGNKGFPANANSCVQQNLVRNNESLTKDANMNIDSQSNFILPADSSCSKNSSVNMQYNMDNTSKKNTQPSESYNNFSVSSQKYNASNAALYNSNYNNNYMNFFSNSQAQVTPSLTSLVSGAGYNFPLSNSKFNSSQQYLNFGQNMSNNSYFPSSNFNVNCGSNYQNCVNQSSGTANPGSSNMNSNFGNNFSGSFCNFPLPYYSNCSFSYNSYPYFYQGGDMSLLSNHAAAAASLMPSFSSRSSLSPRNTSSSQSFNDLHLQSGLFPMMPFVSPLSSTASRGAASPMSMPLSPALTMRPFSNTPYPQKSSYGMHQQSSDSHKSSSGSSKAANGGGSKHKKSNTQSQGSSKLKGNNLGSCSNSKVNCETSKGQSSSVHGNESGANALQTQLYSSMIQSNFAVKGSEERSRKENKSAADNQRSRDKSQAFKGSGGAS